MTESNLVRHARHELSLIPHDGDALSQEMQDAMNEHLVKMVELFSEEGHSGFSASYAIGTLKRLLEFEPLTPLTGADDEWMAIGNDAFQNVRCSHVFKDAQRGAYDITGRIFREPDGCCFTSIDSHVPVTFPYTPSREYVDVNFANDGEAEAA